MCESTSPILLKAMLTDCHTMAAVGCNLRMFGYKVENKALEKKRS